MPKLKCPCGFIHDLCPIPDDGWITVKDADFESLIEAEKVRGVEDAWRHPKNSPEFKELMAADKKYMESIGSLYECPKCGRIMWEKPEEERFKIYKPDDEFNC
jgi:hypothetical protein